MKHRNKDMFKLVKYIIIILLIIAAIYFLKISFKHNAMEIKLKNPHKIENLEQKTTELKKKFSIFEKHEAQHQTTTTGKQKSEVEDKQSLDRFIKEHSN